MLYYYIDFTCILVPKLPKINNLDSLFQNPFLLYHEPLSYGEPAYPWPWSSYHKFGRQYLWWRSFFFYFQKIPRKPM